MWIHECTFRRIDIYKIVILCKGSVAFYHEYQSEQSIYVYVYIDLYMLIDT
jgi:hypothetical protein